MLKVQRSNWSSRSKRCQGEFGGVSLEYNFSNVTDNGVSSGQVAFNNSTMSSITTKEYESYA